MLLDRKTVGYVRSLYVKRKLRTFRIKVLILRCLVLLSRQAGLLAFESLADIQNGVIYYDPTVRVLRYRDQRGPY